MAIVIVGLLQFIACTKTSDSVKFESGNLETTGNTVPPDLSKCKIRKLYQSYLDSPDFLTAIFSYNSSGNPYSVLVPGGGPSAHYFKYDASKRLTEYIQMWDSLEYNHHYYRHNAKNQIIIDSAVYMDLGKPYFSNLHTIEYDAQGRVIKETIVSLTNAGGSLFPTRRPTYTYDAKGNLAVAGWKSSSYDNKINPLRQSPVFQFIHRNYSMNNASVQAKYNSIGLPLSMKRNNYFFFEHIEYSKIAYDCL